MRVVYFAVSWFIGLWLASIWNIAAPTWLLIGSGCLLTAVLTQRQPRFSLFMACLCALSWAGARYVSAVPAIDETHVAFHNGTRNITLTGLVTGEPDIRDRFINLRLTAAQATLADGTTIPVTGQVLVTTFRFPIIEYGTEIEINGQLETPPEREDFNYKEYLARQGIHSLMALPTVTVLAENKGNPLYHTIFAFKRHAQATISRLLPDPQAALLTGSPPI